MDDKHRITVTIPDLNGGHPFSPRVTVGALKKWREGLVATVGPGGVVDPLRVQEVHAELVFSSIPAAARGGKTHLDLEAGDAVKVFEAIEDKYFSFKDGRCPRCGHKPELPAPTAEPEDRPLESSATTR